MGCILAFGAFGILFMWWFAVTYADPKKILLVAVIASVVLAFWGGWRLKGQDK